MLMLLWKPLSYLVSVIIAWLVQRTMFRNERKVPNSSAVVFLVIVLFIPVVNIALSCIVWALSYFIDRKVSFAKFYMLDRYMKKHGE